MAKFWLVVHPIEPVDLQPAAGAASAAQPLAALQGNSWKGRCRQGTWGHYSTSPWSSEKQSPPLLHLSYPGKVIYVGSILDTSRLKYVGTLRMLLGTLFTQRQLPREETSLPASGNQGLPSYTQQLYVSKYLPRPSLLTVNI